MDINNTSRQDNKNCDDPFFILTQQYSTIRDDISKFGSQINAGIGSIKEELTLLKKDCVTMKRQITNCNSRINKNCDDINQFKKDKKEFCNRIDRLFDRVNHLEEKALKDNALDLNGSSSNSSNISNNNGNLHMSEIIDRISRMNNVIIFNLADYNNNTDRQTINKILRKLCIEINSVELERINGKRDSRKIRPLRLKFSKRDDAIRFVKSKEFHPRKAFIIMDQTKYQRLKYQELKKLMMEHNSQYPNNKKFIKYIDGEPQLVDVPVNITSQVELSEVENSLKPPAEDMVMDNSDNVHDEILSQDNNVTIQEIVDNDNEVSSQDDRPRRDKRKTPPYEHKDPKNISQKKPKTDITHPIRYKPIRRTNNADIPISGSSIKTDANSKIKPKPKVISSKMVQLPNISKNYQNTTTKKVKMI